MKAPPFSNISSQSRLQGVWQTLYVESQRVNIFGFMGHSVSVHYLILPL